MIRSRLRLARNALVLACFASFSLPAAAQELPEDQCALLEDPEAEITCLRAVLAATRQAQGETRPATEATGPANADTDRPVTPEPPVTARPAPPVAATSQPDFGGEQLPGAATAPRAEEDREVLASVITDFRVDRYGRLIMQLENGQIWRQVENVGVPIRIDEDERVSVEITRSGFGGYRMSFPEMNRTISVSRER